MYKCPYCKLKSYEKFRSLVSHVSLCSKNDNTYYLDTIYGAIHYTECLNTRLLREKYPNIKATSRNIRKKFQKFLDSDLVFNRKFTKIDCINAIKQFENKYFKVPRIYDFQLHKISPSTDTVCKLFGTWNNALIESGYKPYLEISKEDCICGIQLFFKQNGRVPNTRESKDIPYIPSQITMIKLFGSWNKAIEAAGYTPNEINAFGIPTVAKDGVKYKSQAEAYFVNKFLYGKYQYEYEKPYGNGWKYDFYLPEKDLYIELTAYLDPQRMQDKIDFNIRKNINFKVIDIEDIYKKENMEI